MKTYLHVVWDKGGAAHFITDKPASFEVAQEISEEFGSGFYIFTEDGRFQKQNGEMPGSWYFDEELKPVGAYGNASVRIPDKIVDFAADLV